eukprot:4505135-Amphidinium_carterae.1
MCKANHKRAKTLAWQLDGFRCARYPGYGLCRGTCSEEFMPLAMYHKKKDMSYVTQFSNKVCPSQNIM